MTLTLYRRHTKTCSKGHAKYQRVYRPNGIRQRKADCECPISVEGKLKYEVLINRSTKETSWSEAEAVVSQWEIWGRTTPLFMSLTGCCWWGQMPRVASACRPWVPGMTWRPCTPMCQ